MNYEDMSDFEINKRVAMAESLIINDDQSMSKRLKGSEVRVNDIVNSWWFDPCNAWNDAGPIIIENKITVGNYDGDGIACCNFRGGCHEELWDFEVMNKNPLRAAMICFLKMKDTEL